jgi:hypothetical protein
MNFTDGIILSLFGGVSLFMGIANKGPRMWVSYRNTGYGKKIFGRDYERFINIVFGLFSLLVGLGLILHRK